MNKIKYLIIMLFITIWFIPINVFATGGISISNSNINITKGSSSNFTITANNSAGKIDISSSDSSIASISQSSVFLDMQSVTITINGNSSGTAIIKVYASDVTTYDDENISGKTYTINVNVTEPNNSTMPVKSTNTNIVNNKSKNNNLSSVTIDGYELNKIDNNNYTLTVQNDVSTININAIQEDPKSKISGIGPHELNIGENNIEIIVTSESGSNNVVLVKVTRKEGYYLEDLELLLKDPSKKDINIIINNDTKISSSYLKMIKQSKKKIKFNYYDENKKLIYTWLIDGKQIKDTKDITTTIEYTSENKDNISKISNYSDGLYIDFKHIGKLPKDTQIKLYVGDKYKNNDMVNIYFYNSSKKELNKIHSNLKVKDGYIGFTIENCSEYFITKSEVINVNKIETTFKRYKLLFIINTTLMIIFIILYVLKNKINFKKIES